MIKQLSVWGHRFETGAFVEPHALFTSNLSGFYVLLKGKFAAYSVLKYSSSLIASVAPQSHYAEASPSLTQSHVY